MIRFTTQPVAMFALTGFLFMAPFSARAAGEGMLEIPGNGTRQSGISIVSGWKCDVAGALTARFDGGDVLALSYGTPRGDTESICGDRDNAFVMQWNYANLEDGAHTIEIFEDGVLWRESTFTVQRLGVQFLSGAEGCFLLEDFPSNGETSSVAWQTEAQGFGLVPSCVESTTTTAGTGWPLAVAGAVEIPQSGSTMSGIGVVSGWRCDGGAITAIFDSGDPLPLA
ncbi:MAG: hypothetical protein ABGY42_00055, partial [bacterium]